MANKYEDDLEDIISKFSNVSELTHWAIENNCLSNDCVVNKLEYLLSLENTVKSFHDCNELIAWAVKKQLTYNPLVKARIGLLSSLEGSESHIFCDQ